MNDFTAVVEVSAWMSDFTSHFLQNVITYPCPIPDAALTNFSKWKRPLEYMEYFSAVEIIIQS